MADVMNYNSGYGDDYSDPFDDDMPEETNVAGTSQQYTGNAHAEEEEEEEEEEEDDEDDDEESGRKSRKRPKHRHKRDAAARFLDIEAEVSDEDEDLDEDEDAEEAAFIDTVEGEDEVSMRRQHARLDAQRHFDEDDKSPEQIAEALRQRHGGRTAVRYTGDMNEIPQRLLMPSVHDPSLWQIRVKPGRERDIVFSLMRKAMDVEFTAKPLRILTAFQRDSLPGMVYIEARSAQQVQLACNGLVGVYLSRGVHLVPIEEMASLLQIKKQELTIKPGNWVRVRRGLYAGDLAQVMDVTEAGEDFGLKLVPRIDLNPRDSDPLDSRKRKKVTGALRPQQRVFNYEEVLKVHGRQAVAKRNTVFVFAGDTYRDGFLEKDFKLSNIVTEDINPSLDEIEQFSRRDDSGEIDSSVDLSIIAEASRKAAIAVLQPGDHIEVFEGEQAGVHGIVQEINQDVVTIVAAGEDLEGQKVDLPARSVRKRFKPGDHVKVMTGRNADETGLVVSVAENIVTFLSDMSLQEVSVFSKDLREAAEVGSSTNIIGNYELHDLVQLDLQTWGVIFKTERESFRVLDNHGQVRAVKPHQITTRKDSNRGIATDSDGQDIRVNDNMQEIDGEGRKGRVLHFYQTFFVFLHNRDISENGGVFVTRARSLKSVATKAVKASAVDLSKMNPTAAGGMVGSGILGKGTRDRLAGLKVTVVKGTQKGYIGIIKDTNGDMARVELSTGNKVITIKKDKLKERLTDGTLKVLDGRSGGSNGFRSNAGQDNRSSSNPYNNSGKPPVPDAWHGGATPGWGAAASSRTPNPYNNGDSGRTPAWNSSARTPNPYASQTPAWNASSRTPNPYASESSKTPAWNASARTPNPYSGGQTPGRPTGGWGGATPGRPASSSWGGATPGASSGWGNDSSFDSGGWGSSSAETPAIAATPAAAGPTPGYWGAPTPAPYATPGFSGSAPTPAYGSSSAPAATSNSQYDVPETWFLDPMFSKVLRRIRVVLKGTTADRYLDGTLEGEIGTIGGAQPVAANLDQIASIQFDNAAIGTRDVLGKYILPLEPSRENEALVLTGKLKGEVAKIWDITNSQVTISTADAAEWGEMASSELAQLKSV